VEAGSLYDGACRGGGRVCTVAVGVPGREVLGLQGPFVNSSAVKPCTNDLAVTVAAVPALPDFALAFPP